MSFLICSIIGCLLISFELTDLMDSDIDRSDLLLFKLGFSFLLFELSSCEIVSSSSSFLLAGRSCLDINMDGLIKRDDRFSIDFFKKIKVLKLFAILILIIDF